MKDYEILYNDEELNKIIDSVNEANKDYLMLCHGRYHTMFVIATIEYILSSLGYDSRTIELGKITGLLHDIGTIEGKKGHAGRSVIMAPKYLDKTSLTAAEKEIVIHSIADHSKGEDITSPIGAALLIADKIDLSRNRVLALGYNDDIHKNLCNIDKVEITIANHVITINLLTNSDFSLDVIIANWEKSFTVPIKASKYLDCKCIFQHNNKELTLENIS